MPSRVSTTARSGQLATKSRVIQRRIGHDGAQNVGARHKGLDLTHIVHHRQARQTSVKQHPRQAALELRPMAIAQWCLQMAHRVTEFYHEVNVLEADFGVKQARLQLVAAAQSVLILGLDLLGIETPERM